MIIYDKKYLSELSCLGLLCSVYLVEAIFQPGKREMAFRTSGGRTIYAETKKGDAKIFATIEAAKKYAADLGFKGVELSW